MREPPWDPGSEAVNTREVAGGRLPACPTVCELTGFFLILLRSVHLCFCPSEMMIFAQSHFSLGEGAAYLALYGEGDD